MGTEPGVPRVTDRSMTTHPGSKPCPPSRAHGHAPPWAFAGNGVESLPVSRLPVYVPHIERGPHPGVIAAIAAQGFEPFPWLTSIDDPMSYSEAMREWWRAGTGFMIVEQDARPPDSALTEYEACPEPLCSRPHNCRRLGVMGSLACVKFSRELVNDYPLLADQILARERPLEWWKHGFYVNRPYRPGEAVPSDLRNACVDPAAVAHLGPWPGPKWPTTQEWPHTDTVLFDWLGRNGVPTHYHEEPSVCYPDPNEHFPGTEQSV